MSRNMRAHRWKTATALAASFATLPAFAGPALAENAPAARAEEEVVVTARRRAEALQEVPAAISVISSDKMFETGTDSVEKLRDVIPNFQFASDMGTRSRIAVRGLGSDRSGAQTNGVGFFIDGVYQSGTARLNAPFFDVERIEVLKGPQGARYGRNSFAGVINIVTRKPDDELKISAQGVVENSGGLQYGGMIAGPIIEGELFGKLSYSHIETDGDYQHAITGKDMTASKADFYSARLAWKPTDNLEFDLNGNAFDYRAAGFAFSVTKSLQDLRENYLGRDDQVGNTKAQEVSLRITWGFDDFEVVSLSAWRHTKSYTSVDGDVSPPDGFLSYGGSDSYQKSTEVRVQSTGDGPFNWLVGGEYVDSNADANSNVFFGPDVAMVNPAYAPLVGLTAVNDISSSATNKALFGELSYTFFDRLEATISVRYDDIHKNVVNSTSTRSTRRTFDDSALQPLFSLRYDIDDSTNIYASAARGIREGGFNSASLTKDYGIFASDDAWSYEVGLKKTFGGGAFLNVSLFYMDAEVYNQAAITVTDAGSLANGAITLGGIESYGLELDTAVPLDEAITWSLNAALLDCSLTDIPPYSERSPDLRQVSPGVKTGNECQDSSAWSFNTALDGNWALGSSEWTLFGRIALSGKGETRLATDAGVNVIPGGTPEQRLFRRSEEFRKSLYLVDASIGVDNGNWKVILYGENLTDELYATDHFTHEGLAASGILSLGAGNFITTLAPGRRVGLRVRWDY